MRKNAAVDSKQQKKTFSHFIRDNLLNCSLTEIANQSITWRDLDAFNYVDRVKTEVQKEHQNGEERGFKLLLMACIWCQKGWSGYFRTC